MDQDNVIIADKFTNGCAVCKQCPSNLDNISKTCDTKNKEQKTNEPKSTTTEKEKCNVRIIGTGSCSGILSHIRFRVPLSNQPVIATESTKKTRYEQSTDTFPTADDLADQMIMNVIDEAYQKMILMTFSLEARTYSINMNPHIWTPDFRKRILTFFANKGFNLDISKSKRHEDPDQLVISW